MLLPRHRKTGASSHMTCSLTLQCSHSGVSLFWSFEDGKLESLRELGIRRLFLPCPPPPFFKSPFGKRKKLVELAIWQCMFGAGNLGFFAKLPKNNLSLGKGHLNTSHIRLRHNIIRKCNCLLSKDFSCKETKNVELCFLQSLELVLGWLVCVCVTISPS